MDATCGRCGVVHHVEIASPDFRCETCAVLEVDEAAKRQTRNGLKILAAGAALFALAAIMWMTKWNPGDDSRADDDGMSLIFYVGTGAVGLLGLGLGMLKFRPRLRR